MIYSFKYLILILDRVKSLLIYQNCIYSILTKHFFYFSENVKDKQLCELHLSEEEVQSLKESIEEHYYYEFVIDDIPVRDFIGHLEESGFVAHTHKIYLWTHQHFSVYYNEDKVSIMITKSLENYV